MKYLRTFIRLWLSLNLLTFHSNSVPESEQHTTHGFLSAFIPGNITLGGLFPVFLPGKDGKCSVVNSALGIPQLEALLFSIDRINANETFLPNITLGVKAYDTCGSEMAALNRAVKGFVLGEDYIPGMHSYTYHDHPQPVVGVVGPGYSYEAVHVTPFLGLFEIPIVSYGATSPMLSDKLKYKYFSRTIPQDSSQGKVIVELLNYFNWTYVSLVYSEEPYGRSGYDVIKNEAKKYGICFAEGLKLPQKYSEIEYRRVVRKILSHEQAKTVVLFCIEPVILPFMKEIWKQAGSQKLQFIGSETLAMLMDWKDVRSIGSGAIFTLPATNPVKEFNEYFLNLSIDNNPRNPWFREFFQEAAKCSLKEHTKGFPMCNSSQTLRNINYSVELANFNPIPFVFDGVYAFAHALRVFLDRNCFNGLHGMTSCKILGKDLLAILRSSTFESYSGKTVNISITGDVSGGYGVYCMDEVRDELFESIKIGEWEKELRIFQNSRNWKFLHVRSQCWKKCKPGEIRHGVPGKPSCCSKCVPCSTDAFVLNETSCVSCKKGYKPDRGRRMCVRIETRYLTIDGRLVPLVLVLLPILVSGLSILGLFFTIGVFIKYNHTPLVKASARELSYLLLVGLFLSYLFPFVSILKPTSFRCFLQFLLDSLPFTISLVAIAVKNNRTFRIFDPNRRLTSAPLFVNPRAQMAVSLALICFQILLLVLVVIFECPHEKLVYPSSTEVHLVCAISPKQQYISHLYNVVLLVVCTYYAYKTKNIHRNFNEAKYIVFAMYGACVMFLAVMVVSVTSRDSPVSQRPIIVCYRVTFTATIFFASFFVPKLHIILWKPEQNRKHSMTEGTSSAVGEAGDVTEDRPRERRLPSNALFGDVKDDDMETVTKYTINEVYDQSTQTDW